MALLPLKTFHLRIYKKWKFLINYRLLPFLHLKGARKFEELQNGNVLISLNASSSLGPKGTVIEVPKDKIIYEELRHRGEWEKEVSNFLSTCIKDLKKESSSITVVDLESKMEYIHKQNTNSGNTSLIARVVPIDQVSKVRIKMLDTEDFSINYLTIDKEFVIKSDLQGFDAKVLARLGKKIWEKTYAASVEVWALNEIERQDVVNLIENWKCFNKISWSSSFSNVVTLEEVQEFWLSASNTHRNIYLRK